MLLSISRMSKHSKKHWYFKYSNENFDEIIKLIFYKMQYDYIALTIWPFQMDLFKDFEYKYLVDDKRFSTIIFNKTYSIKFIDSEFYDEIRMFEINIYYNNKKLFNIESDNYGEYTSIRMNKVIEEDELLQMLDEIFNEYPNKISDKEC